MKEQKIFILGEHNGTRIEDARYGTLWELIAPTDGTLKTMGFAWAEVNPNAESPLHYHEHTEEIYHIMRGEGEMTVDGKTVKIGPGTTIGVPVSMAHKIRAYQHGLAFVVVTSPPYDPEDDIEI